MTENKNFGLSGSWVGNYYYSSATTAYGFEAVFIEDNGKLTGNILDLNVHGEANVTGTFACPKIEFTKLYYKTNNLAINYEGVLSADGKSMAGTWQIPPMARGNWIAWRIEEEEGMDDVDMDVSLDEEKERETQRPLVMPGR